MGTTLVLDLAVLYASSILDTTRMSCLIFVFLNVENASHGETHFP